MAYTTIKKPSDYFRTKTFTGNATNDTAITWDESSNMQPDFLWFKNRSQTQSHALFDSTRGAILRLISNSNGAEGTENTNLDSFDTNGFTVDYEAIVNGSGDNMVAWGWKANGGTTSSNTDGSITSTVQSDTTSGFSIVSYTGNATSGATVGHGLGVAPSVVVCKNRDASGNSWGVYHKSMGTDLVFWDATDTATSYSTIYNNTVPSSSLVTLGNGANANGNNQNIILYCFAEKQGYSKFGSYVGNASTNGTFVYTGFKPAFVMVKKYAGTGSWFMKDAKRNPYNPAEETLAADSASSAAGWGTGDDIDLLSNGFKMRDDTANINTSGDGYIYMAFAEQPLVGDNPATAR